MHPLDGPRLKVRRAESEIEAFRRGEEVFWKEAHYKVVRAEFNPKTQKYAYRLSMKVAPPQELGVLIGEMAHDLRSALDGLVYQLALLKTKTPASNTQFPIFLVGRTKRRRRGKRGGLIPHFEGMGLSDGRSMIRDLRPEHQAMIERLQPYKRGRGHHRDPLFLLREINNADKHRLIQVVGLKPTGLMWFGSGTVIEEPSRQRRPVVLKDGAKLCEFSADVRVNPQLIPLITFSEGCEAVKNRAVVVTFDSIVEEVSKIMEGFGPEFE
jgi:hypothetical protein